MTTHLLTLDPITGASVRVPFNLDTLRADWSQAEPYHEPPSLVCDGKPRRCKRKHYPARIRLEQIRIAMQRMDRPTHLKIAEAIGVSRSRVSQIFERLEE